MRIGDIELLIFDDGNTATITKHYNSAVTDKIKLNEDDIYALEFAVQEMKRKLGLK